MILLYKLPAMLMPNNEDVQGQQHQPAKAGISLSELTAATLNLSPSNDIKKPSEYIRERVLTTTERLAVPSKYQTEIIAFTDIAEPNQRDFRVPIDQPIFKPLPAEVVLQNFVPFQTYEVLISFRNVDKVL